MGVRRRQLGLQPQGLQVGRPRLDELLRRPQHIAQVVVQGRHVGLEPDRLLAVRQRLRVLAAVQQHLAQVRPRRREVRLQLDRLVEVLQRLIEPAEVPQHDPQVVVRRGERRPQLDRPAELVDGLGLLPQPLERQPQVAQRLGIVGPQRQRRPAAPGRPVQLPRGPIRLRQIRVERRHVRLERHRPADQLDRPGIIAALMVKHPEQVQRHGVLLLLRQDPLVERGRLAEPAPLVHLDGRRQDVLHRERPRKLLSQCPRTTGPIRDRSVVELAPGRRNPGPNVNSRFMISGPTAVANTTRIPAYRCPHPPEVLRRWSG